MLYALMVRSSHQKSSRLHHFWLFGPLGIGKTILWMRAARSAEWTIFDVIVDVLLPTYQGQSEKYVTRELRSSL